MHTEFSKGRYLILEHPRHGNDDGHEYICTVCMYVHAHAHMHARAYIHLYTHTYMHTEFSKGRYLILEHPRHGNDDGHDHDGRPENVCALWVRTEFACACRIMIGAVL